MEKVQQQDATIRTQQQLLAVQQQQSADLRIKTLEDLAAIRDQPAADPARPARAHIKIPQLILSKFSNKKEEWQEFWASFEISVGDTSMGNKEKLTHLKTLLAAKKEICNLQLTDEKYEPAVNILKKRFSCTQETTETHLKELHPPKVSKCRDAAGYHQLKLHMFSHLEALKNLGVFEAETKLIIGPAIISALPDEAVTRWHDLPDAEITDPKAVMKFLDELIKSAERHERTQTGRTKEKLEPQPSESPASNCSQLETSVTTKPKGRQASKPESTKKRYPCPYNGADHARDHRQKARARSQRKTLQSMSEQ